MHFVNCQIIQSRQFNMHSSKTFPTFDIFFSNFFWKDFCHFFFFLQFNVMILKWTTKSYVGTVQQDALEMLQNPYVSATLNYNWYQLQMVVNVFHVKNVFVLSICIINQTENQDFKPLTQSVNYKYIRYSEEVRAFSEHFVLFSFYLILVQGGYGFSFK